MIWSQLKSSVRHGGKTDWECVAMVVATKDVAEPGQGSSRDLKVSGNVDLGVEYLHRGVWSWTLFHWTAFCFDFGGSNSLLMASVDRQDSVPERDGA